MSVATQAESKQTKRGRLLYVPGIAEELDRSVGQVNWMIHTGQLPGTAKVAGRRCIREEDLHAWIDAHFKD